MKHSTCCKLLYAIWSIPSTFVLKCKGVNTSGIVFTGGRIAVFRAKGSTINIGRKCRFMSWSLGNLIGINHRCIISTYSKNAKLVIGDNCSFSGVSIWCNKRITIGNSVRVGANCTIMDSDQHNDDPRSGGNKPIVIEDNVWIGGAVTVMKGVTIGRNSIIGYGSIVTKDIPANVVAAGNPCKVLRRLSVDVIDKLEGMCEC